jgi:hypothetical protein
MNQRFMARLAKWLIPSAVGAIMISSVPIYFFFIRAPQPPPTIVLSACGEIPQGMRRVGSTFSTQFVAREKDFTFRSAARDMPPGMLSVVTLKGGSANMLIWDGGTSFDEEFNRAIPVFSAHVEERDVRTPKGRVVGKDRWGYLKSGERWRHVRFSWGDEVEYRPVSPKQARLLDQVINSACLLPAQNSSN